MSSDCPCADVAAAAAACCVLLLLLLLLLLRAACQVFILQGTNMQAAAYINPDQNDYSSYANVHQSMLLRFGIAAVWFLVLGVGQVRHGHRAADCSRRLIVSFLQQSKSMLHSSK
jgi:hypothetical protein